VDEVGGACGTNGGEEERVEVIGRKAEGKRPLGRLRRRCVHNIKIDLVEIEWCDVDWNALAQDRDKWKAFVNAEMNLWAP
jgi:hypothetical protein